MRERVRETFFRHVVRADPKQDHPRVIGASFRPPSHWRRPCGRPRTSWLRAIDTDVQSVNIGTHSAWRNASDHTLWRRIVDTATLHHGARHWRERERVALTYSFKLWIEIPAYSTLMILFFLISETVSWHQVQWRSGPKETLKFRSTCMYRPTKKSWCY